MQHRLPKYYRNAESQQALSRRRITGRDLYIIDILARYRMVPTSLLVRLVGGDRSSTYGHLQALYHKRLINRFHIPRTGPANEFIYYLDNPRAADLLADFEYDTSDIDLAEIKRNRENGYHRVNDPYVPEEEKPSLLFIRHELMISRFQGCLELGCRESEGVARLLTFCRKRSQLKHSFPAPKLERAAGDDGSELWIESKEWEWLPHDPDAFFTVRFLQRPPGDQDRNFFYECDRRTESIPRFIRKLRAHHQFILRQKNHRHIERHFGVNRIRAVLTETINDEWADVLRSVAACSPMIAPKPSGLFWFTTSRMLVHGPQSGREAEEQPSRQMPYYLAHPQIILRSIWAAPTAETLYSLHD